MATSDAGNLITAINHTVSRIQELGNNWYISNTSWEELPNKIDRLNAQYDVWQKGVKKYGMSSEARLTKTLHVAKQSLEAKEAKLLKRRGSRSVGCFKVSRTLFPAKVGLDIEAATEAFRSISELLKLEEEVEAGLEKKLLRRAFSLPFRKDDSYVRLKDSEFAIHSALKSSTDGPVVVLLHGPPGKGKSTLARAVALNYEKAVDTALNCKKAADAAQQLKEEAEVAYNALQEKGPAAVVACIFTKVIPTRCKAAKAKSARPQNEEAADKYKQATDEYEQAEHKYKEAAENDLFEQVAYLECGPQADILAKQFELLQLLGAIADPRQQPSVVAADPQGQARQSSFDSDLPVPKRLKAFLKDRKLLIVFDDVWEANFLQKMLDLCGRRIKCLVTSRWDDLCRSITTIPIRDVKQEDARKILASHVGFRDLLIPEKLKGIADEMIEKTDSNPLALAILAGLINPSPSIAVVKWTTMSENLFKSLHCEPKPDIRSSTNYPRSFWSAMMLSFDNLNENAQKLLILVGMCNGQVPEEVIHLLYWSTNIKHGFAPFSMVQQELESRKLVKITTVSEGSQERYSWSMHGLQKKFITDMINYAKRLATFTSLGEIFYSESGSIVESKVVKEMDIIMTLGAVFFDKEFATMAAVKVSIPSPMLNNLRCNLKESHTQIPPQGRGTDLLLNSSSSDYNKRCSAIEPIVRLLRLMKPLDDGWTEKLCNSTNEVFMGYVCNDVLNDNHISNLLLLPNANLAMMRALSNMCMEEITTMLDDNLHGYMMTLIDLLQEVDGKGYTNVNEATAEALVCLSSGIE